MIQVRNRLLTALDGTLIQVGLNSEAREEVPEDFRNLLAMIMLSIVAIGLGAASFSPSEPHPIRVLLQTLRSILATGNLTPRAPVTDTRDELDELSTLFNSMFVRIDGLILGMQGALDNVAHDLHTSIDCGTYRKRGYRPMNRKSHSTRHWRSV